MKFKISAAITLLISGLLIAPLFAKATVPVEDSEAISQLQNLNTKIQETNCLLCKLVRKEVGSCSDCQARASGGGFGGIFRSLGGMLGGGGSGGFGGGFSWQGFVGQIGSSVGGAIGGQIGGMGLGVAFGSLAGGLLSGGSWDSIAYSIAKSMLRTLTDSVVDWIRNGFEGKPLFITNFEDYLLDAADQASGIFLREYLSPEVYNAICSPFRIQISLALQRAARGGSSYGQRMQCTLSTVLQNVQRGVSVDINAYYTDFSQGGWSAWFSLLDDQNNPYFAIQASVDELKMRQIASVSQAHTESVFNLGFIGYKECEMWDYNPSTGERNCISWKTLSPGKWIESQLSSATGVDFEEMALADELNEIIMALINYLTSELMRGIAR
jgi:hypothetical protein